MKQHTIKAKELTERHGRVIFMTGAYWYVDTLTLSHHLAPNLKVAEHAHRTGSNVLFYTTPAGNVAEVVPTHFSEDEWIRNQAYLQFRKEMALLEGRRHCYQPKAYFRMAAQLKQAYANALNGTVDSAL